MSQHICREVLLSLPGMQERRTGLDLRCSPNMDRMPRNWDKALSSQMAFSVLEPVVEAA